MINFHTLVTLSENDKRMIFSILLIVILLLVLIGVLGYALFRIMKWQSRKMDTLIHDVVVYKVITDKKHLVRYGRSKNWALFFKQAYIPLIIIAIGAIVWVVYGVVYNNWAYNPFSTYDGFGTLFWTWKYSGEFTGGPMDIIRFQIIVIDNTPHLVLEAWAGYVIGPCFIVGGLWYVIAASSLLARSFILQKRSREIFEKSLVGYRQNEAKIPEAEPADSSKEESSEN